MCPLPSQTTQSGAKASSKVIDQFDMRREAQDLFVQVNYSFFDWQCFKFAFKITCKGPESYTIWWCLFLVLCNFGNQAVLQFDYHCISDPVLSRFAVPRPSDTDPAWPLLVKLSKKDKESKGRFTLGKHEVNRKENAKDTLWPNREMKDLKHLGTASLPHILGNNQQLIMSWIIYDVLWGTGR